MTLPRMRTASGVLAEILKDDPQTGITLHHIKHLIKTNKVPVVSVGRKKLVDVDAVIAYLAEGTNKEPEDTLVKIRRVAI